MSAVSSDRQLRTMETSAGVGARTGQVTPTIGTVIELCPRTTACLQGACEASARILVRLVDGAFGCWGRSKVCPVAVTAAVTQLVR